MTDRSVWIRYTNYRGETAWRHVLPLVWDYAPSPWHEDCQWVMHATDLDKGERRTFAMQNILEWRTAAPEATSGQA